MDFLRVAILMVHPLLALALIWTFMRQRSWRREREGLLGSERTSALMAHEKSGNRIMAYLLVVILVAFTAQIVDAIILGQSTEEALRQLIPNHYHGWAGILALALMGSLWYLGRKTSSLSREGESIVKIKDLHGRLGDVMAVLVIIHAFLGFLYFFQIV
jgi:hypothetical protein